MSSGDGGGLGAVAMPQGTKKMVQSLKEIVNCPEEEIYATLKDCDMDPNEAVNRLILQDSFHEVKKKREKKEAKGTPEYRSQYGNLNRGARGGFDRNGRNNDTYIKSSDNRVARGKLAQNKDYGASTVSNSARAVKEQAMGLDDDIAFPPQPSSTSQHNWSGMQDHRSMADIVRMGRPHEKPSTPIVGTNASQSRTSYNAVVSNKLQGSDEKNKLKATGSLAQSSQEVHSSEDFHSKGTCNYEPVEANTVSQDTSLGDWSIVDQSPSENGQMYSESSAASSFYHEPTVPSTAHVDGDAINYASAPDGQIQVDNYEDNYCLVDGPIKNISSYESPGRAYDFHEVSVEDASTKLSIATSKLQQLSLQGEQNVEDAVSMPAVIIPAHLQVTNADCSHLCFGSFGSGISAPLSEPFASVPMRNNFEASSIRDNPSHARESEHYDNEPLQSTLDKSTPSSTSTNNGKYDTAPAPQQDIATDDRFNAHQLQHNSSSISGYSLTGAEQLNAAANYYAHANLQMQNFGPYSSAAAMKPGLNSIPQSSPQDVPNTSASTIPSLPQHLPVHPYSHPTLPSAHFPNMGGYPFPQSYTYMPSAFQQANSDSSAFHQSAAAYNSPDFKYALPQYKSSLPVNSFPPSAGVASGYGGFGSSANVPGSLMQNPSRKSGGYEEALGSQYRDRQQFLPPRQNENIPLWLQGAGSRTLPAAAYYNYQNPQSSVRQSQVPSQYGAGVGAGAGYLNMYHSPPGISQEHQQHLGEGNLSSQGGQASQLPHNWQCHY